MMTQPPPLPRQPVAPPVGCERSALLLSHESLVAKVARRIKARLPAGVEIDDLMQAGMIGLDEALKRFEHGQGACFDTYASRRIEGAMLDELRAADTLSRDARSRVREASLAVHRLEQRLGRTPRAKEVANELNWSLSRFHACMVEAGAGGARSTDEALDFEIDEKPAASGDSLLFGPTEHTDPAKGLQQRQRHAALNAAFDALDERERMVMDLLYTRELSLDDAAKYLGVSRTRVHQMRDAIIDKLHRRMRDV